MTLFRAILYLALAYSGLLFATEADNEGPYSRKGADSCLACHDQPMALGVFAGAHGRPGNHPGPFGDGQLQCEACHGPGGDHAGRVRRGQERPSPVVTFTEEDASAGTGMCLSCHQGDVGMHWAVTAHSGEIACQDCHTIHAREDPVLLVSEQANVCFACHNEQRVDSRKRFSHPIEQNMDCSSCHDVHDVNDKMMARADVNQTCHQCHADKRGPYLWEHAPVVEDCTLCHEAHGSNHAGMVTRRMPFLCQSCHANAGHPSLAPGDEGLASATPSKYLLGKNCVSCHSQVHGSNHPSGSRLMR